VFPGTDIRRSCLRRGRTYLGAAVTVFAVAAAIGGCSSGGDNDSSQAAPRTPHTSPADGSTATTPHSTRPTTTPPITMPTQDRTLPTFTAGVGMSEWLPYGALDVRALSYKKGRVSIGTFRSRLDVVTVEECADTGSAVVRHRTWHLVDASGHTLGSAGAKLVGNSPSEDIPQHLTPGNCLQTELVIQVPWRSVPVAVKDGANNTWVLAD
jgi:hypothetical protein